MLVPKPFQHVAIKKIIDYQGQIVGDECGLGKTLVAIEAVRACNNSHARVLVVAPPVLHTQWHDAIVDQGYPAPLQPLGFPLKQEAMQGWILTSQYELQRKNFLANLCDVLWDFVIVDEAHRIKNKDTDFFKNVSAIPKVRGVALTGTPIEKGEEDLWALLNFVQPDEFPAYWGFVISNLETSKGFWNEWIIKGPKDPLAFAELISPYFIRRTKEEVLPELPEKIMIPVRVEMTERQQQMYKQVKQADDIIAEYHIGDIEGEFIIKNALALLTRLQQIASAPMLVGESGIDSGKIEWLKEFLEDHPKEPTVVFSRFKDWLPPLCQMFDGVMVAGNQDSSAFFTEGQVNRLFGTIDKMGEGLNLQRAKHAIFLDGHWSSRATSQAIDRIHRMDIKEPKNIYMLSSCREDKMIYQSVIEKWTEQEFFYNYLKELRDG